ncbi:MULTISPECIES: Hsp70 family protein [unclassified Rhodococcus (in: high G+C Gram-positive bacteria)]|uniref:Hsp70 family protein n=1 Tax=unclassified Rhodococcus (in: high G+C Gram-positive bacteria) TaxID=192944 RepID=UPI001FFBF863|nr:MULTISPECIES: Hsp70 family protein [unclassified Rhodococcus (in: high G+C Gram-positive bacteria)]
MTEVLGVSVGSSAVRMARPDLRLYSADRPTGRQGLDFYSDTVDAYWQDCAEDVAAESIGVLLSQRNGNPEVEATGVAYRDQQQFGEIQQAMANQRLYNYRLVPEARAALTYLEASGELANFGTIGLYDLGSSGLTISVIDRASGEVLLAERTTDISGDDFDRLICDNQLSRRGAEPPPVLGIAEFTSRCRIAKEQLSVNGAVCLPGDSGVILISREAFEALVTVPIEYSARLLRDVLTRSPQYVDAVFLIGGGARIPLVETIIRSWTGLPVVTPHDPESVAAKGAALLATPVENLATEAASSLALTGAPEWLSPEPVDRPATSTRKVRGAALVAGGLAVIAALGLTLGYGNSDNSTSAPTDTVEPTTTVPSTTRPAPSTTTVPRPTPQPVVPVPEPVETYEAPQYEDPTPVPAPAPAPEPPPLIPGLPGLKLPQFQIPPPPVFELPRF